MVQIVWYFHHITRTTIVNAIAIIIIQRQKKTQKYKERYGRRAGSERNNIYTTRYMHGYALELVVLIHEYF